MLNPQALQLRVGVDVGSQCHSVAVGLRRDLGVRVAIELLLHCCCTGQDARRDRRGRSGVLDAVSCPRDYCCGTGGPVARFDRKRFSHRRGALPNCVGRGDFLLVKTLRCVVQPCAPARLNGFVDWAGTTAGVLRSHKVAV